jgi:hypothetical protein
MNEIQGAIDELAPGLGADGFELRLEAVEPDGSVRIALEAGPDACIDCLVPDELLVSILEASIRERMPDAKVVLEKHGF